MANELDLAIQIAQTSLEIRAIKLNTKNPFTWASGYRMPIYNDNRLFLGNAAHRQMISRGFRDFIKSSGEHYMYIAGTSTAGISPGTTLADNLFMPFIYIRDKPKDHGLQNQIEGIEASTGLEGGKVLLIEDLISTGGSSVKAVQAIRDAGGECNQCLSIFSYGFDEAKKMFYGELPYDKEGHKLTKPCMINSLLTYDTLLMVAKERNYINPADIALLNEWRADPFNWGAKHGFLKVEKK